MPTNKPEVVLPELPEPDVIVEHGYGQPHTRAHSDDQLRAYGQVCIDILTRPAAGDFVMVPDSIRRLIFSKDLYELLLNVQNGIDSPGSASMANSVVQLLDEARDAAMLSAAPQQRGQEVGDGRLPEYARSHEGQRLYSLAYSRGRKKGREEAVAQPHQPAEAVAVDLERFRPMVEKYRVDWAAYVQTMQKAGRSAVDGKKKVDEACELLAIIDNAPPAIDIGKLRAENERLNAIINTPQADDFLRAVSIDAEHQRQRWGNSHDAGKEPADWFWLIGYLAGKALHAHAAGKIEKAEHHVITTAAACANWHRAMFGGSDMRPGIDGEAALIGDGGEAENG